MIEPVIERRADDADAALAHIGEIGQADPSRRVLLPEDDVLLGAVARSPSADAPLQRAADLVENGDRTQQRGALQQRHDLAVPDPGQRTGRRRPRDAFFCNGRRGASSIR